MQINDFSFAGHHHLHMWMRFFCLQAIRAGVCGDDNRIDVIAIEHLKGIKVQAGSTGYEDVFLSLQSELFAQTPESRNFDFVDWSPIPQYHRLFDKSIDAEQNTICVGTEQVHEPAVFGRL